METWTPILSLFHRQDTKIVEILVPNVFSTQLNLDSNLSLSGFQLYIVNTSLISYHSLQGVMI